MVQHNPVYELGNYLVTFNTQQNAWNPYSVTDTVTGKRVFMDSTLELCIDYIQDNTDESTWQTYKTYSN